MLFSGVFVCKLLFQDEGIKEVPVSIRLLDVPFGSLISFQFSLELDRLSHDREI